MNYSATGESVAANGHGAATVYHAAGINGDMNALLVDIVCWLKPLKSYSVFSLADKKSAMRARPKVGGALED